MRGGIVGDYHRRTRECSFEELQPELLPGLNELIRKHDLGFAPSEALICVETTSERKKGGLAGKLLGASGKVQYTGAVVTPRLLIWVTIDGKGKSHGIWAKLSDIEVKDYGESEFNRHMEDTGVEIFGFLADAPERSYSFIGLGEEETASKFLQVLADAVQKAGA
jgi:hypothetical protein